MALKNNVREVGVTIRKSLWLVLWGCLLLIILTACQEVSTLTGRKSNPAFSQWFSYYPYQSETLLPLEKLLGDSDFRRYLTKQPYLWGTSRNGRYLATMVYDQRQNACRLDLFDTHYQKRVMGFAFDFYDPKKADSKMFEEEKEHIRLVEQALREGYHLEVPVRPIVMIPNQKIAADSKGEWWVTPSFSNERIRIVAENGQKRRFVLLEMVVPSRTPSSSPFFYQVKWGETSHMVVFVQQKSGGFHIAIRPIQPEAWRRLPSEDRLEKHCFQLLKQSCHMVYRDPVHFRFYLMADQSWDSKIGEKGYIGNVGAFALFDESGKPMVVGGKEGLKDQQGSTNQQKADHFRVHLEVTDRENRKGRFWVDVHDGNHRIIHTEDWVWSERKKRFE